MRHLIALAALAASAHAFAAYPERPIRIIVPYAPGGNIDITARTFAPALGETLGVTIVVDNRSGAGGTLGTEVVAKAAPDGYTVLFNGTSTLSTAAVLYPKAQFDAAKDFLTVTTVSMVPLMIVTHSGSGPKTLADLIKLAKARPGRITFGSAGIGTSNHLTGELFQSAAGVKLMHVPYKGSGLALIDLMGGQIDIMFDQVSSSIGYIKGGKLRAIAVTTLKRAAALPDVPTLDESGMKGFDSSTTSGVWLPSATPRAVVSTVHAAMMKVLRLPSTREGFGRVGAEVLSSTPEEFAAIMRRETAKWSKVVRDANVKLE